MVRKSSVAKRPSGEGLSRPVGRMAPVPPGICTGAPLVLQALEWYRAALKGEWEWAAECVAQVVLARDCGYCKVRDFFRASGLMVDRPESLVLQGSEEQQMRLAHDFRHFMQKVFSVDLPGGSTLPELPTDRELDSMLAEREGVLPDSSFARLLGVQGSWRL